MMNKLLKPLKVAFITDICGKDMAAVAEMLHAAGVYVIFICPEYADLSDYLSAEFIADTKGYFCFKYTSLTNHLYLSYIQEHLEGIKRKINLIVHPSTEISGGGLDKHGSSDVRVAIEKTADAIFSCARTLKKELDADAGAYIITEQIPYDPDSGDIIINVAAQTQLAIMRSLNNYYREADINVRCIEAPHGEVIANVRRLLQRHGNLMDGN